MSVVGDESVGNSAAKLATPVPSTPCSELSKQVVWGEGLLSRRQPNPHVIEVQLSRLVGSTRLIGRVDLDANVSANACINPRIQKKIDFLKSTTYTESDPMRIVYNEKCPDIE